MSLAQNLIARGEARGEARGIAVGEARGKSEGKAEGLWIGKIQLLEQMMGREIAPTAELESLGLQKLEERFTVLEAEYSAKFKQQ